MEKGYLQAIRIKLRKRGLSTRAIEQEIDKITNPSTAKSDSDDVNEEDKDE